MVLAETKLVESCFNSDLALVSFPEVAFGFKYDSNHRAKMVAFSDNLPAKLVVSAKTVSYTLLSLRCN